MTQTTQIEALSHTAGQGTLLPKWSALRTIEEARGPLNLKSTTLSLLRAMIGLLPVDHIGPVPDHHICFASNQTLATRIHVSITTIERHISILVNAGLILRVCARNGKRWARRDRQGRVTVVSGLSLAPMVEKQAALQQAAQEETDRLSHLDTLRDRCKILLAQLSGAGELLARARNILRRKPNQTALQGLLEELTTNLGGTDTPFEGHKDTNSIPKDVPELTQKDMEKSFPRLCSELRTARSNEDCYDRMDQMALELHLGAAWTAAKRLGSTLSFMLMGYLLQKVEKIKRPGAYLRTLTLELEHDQGNWRSLVL